MSQFGHPGFNQPSINFNFMVSGSHNNIKIIIPPFPMDPKEGARPSTNQETESDLVNTPGCSQKARIIVRPPGRSMVRFIPDVSQPRTSFTGGVFGAGILRPSRNSSTPTSEGSPRRTQDRTDGRSPAQTPDIPPEQSPERSPARTSDNSPERSPARTPDNSPERSCSPPLTPGRTIRAPSKERRFRVPALSPGRTFIEYVMSSTRSPVIIQRARAPGERSRPQPRSPSPVVRSRERPHGESTSSDVGFDVERRYDQLLKSKPDLRRVIILEDGHICCRWCSHPAPNTTEGIRALYRHLARSEWSHKRVAKVLPAYDLKIWREQRAKNGL